jgi:hypothetical protein
MAARKLTPEEKIISTEKRKAYKKAYMKEYNKTYNAMPETKEHRKILDDTSERKKYFKEYNALPEVKTRYHTRNTSPEMKMWHKINYAKPERKLYMINANYKKYDSSDEQFNEMLLKQNSCCAICGKHQSEFKRRLDTDHNHEKRNVRAILCSWCNLNLGKFEHGKKFNEKQTKLFEEYLIKYDTGSFMLKRITERRFKIQDLIAKAKAELVTT